MTIEPEGEDTIVAKVPMDVIGEVNETWKYVVLVLSWDGYATNKIREIGVTAQAYLGGGAEAEAVIAGVQPYVYDLLAPQGKNQTDILKSYSITQTKYATVYAVGAEAGPPPSQPPTVPTDLIIAVLVVVLVIVILSVTVWLRRRKKK
jgi:carbohydrate-binding DOMON domain-containing protein